MSEQINSADVQNNQVNSVFQQLINESEYLKANSYIPYYREMGKGPKSYLKRLVRRLNRCIFMPILEKQNDLNLHISNSIEVSRAIILEQAAQLDTMKYSLTEMKLYYDSRLKEAQEKEETYRRQMTAEKEMAETYRRQIAAEKETAEVYKKQILQDIKGLNDKLALLEARQTQTDRGIDEMTMSFAQMIRQTRSGSASGSTEAETDKTQMVKEQQDKYTEERESEGTYSSIDYFKFQNQFRGTQNQIMERQKCYLPYFQGKKGKIFDLGCGRGEFLRLLKEENIPAFGVDMYPEYEINGELFDLDITTGDGIATLEEMQEPLGGIFCAQVIEHLGFKTVERLCQLAYEKLEDGACLILETPNPRSLSTYTNAFYLDPTHDKPVHPLLMEYLLKAIGFSDVQILWPDHSLRQLPFIRSNSIENLWEVNNAIERVSGILFGSQDYAVVATK